MNMDHHVTRMYNELPTAATEVFEELPQSMAKHFGLTRRVLRLIVAVVCKISLYHRITRINVQIS